MDEQRFDAVTKAFGSSNTRRRMLLGVLAGALSGTLAQLEAEAKRKRHAARNRHRNDRKRNKRLSAQAKPGKPSAQAKPGKKCLTFGKNCKGKKQYECCDTLRCNESTFTCGCPEENPEYVRCGDQCVYNCQGSSPNVVFNPDTCACECRLDPATCPPGTTAALDPNVCECCVPVGEQLEDCGGDGRLQCCPTYDRFGNRSGGCRLFTDSQCCAHRDNNCQVDTDCCDYPADLCVDGFCGTYVPPKTTCAATITSECIPNPGGNQCFPGCFCSRSTEGNVVCVQNEGFCATPRTCTTSANCPTGEACVDVGGCCLPARPVGTKVCQRPCAAEPAATARDGERAGE